MRILIIEDERPAALALKESIRSVDESAEIVGILTSNSDILEWSKLAEWPDLVFSDIELLDGTVFDSIDVIADHCPIIFTTAYDHFMAEAFDSNGISYLLKPINTGDVKKALAKYDRIKGMVTKEKIDVLIQQIDTLGSGGSYKSRFIIKKGQGMYLLPVDSIAALVMKGGVLNAYDVNNQVHLLSIGLTDFMEQVDPSKIFQLNRSEAIAVEHITRIESYGKDRLSVFVKGYTEHLVSSASKTPSLRKWLGS